MQADAGNRKLSLMRILLATSNPHKRDEIAAIFEACGAAGRVELVTLDELGPWALAIAEPVEDGDTFEANAVKKACYYARATGLPCLADDSGLEVDALGGEPGVYSARYSGAAGERATVDLANNRLVLEKLADTPVKKRSARFVCAMAFCGPQAGARPEPSGAIREGSAQGGSPEEHEAREPVAEPVVVRGTVEGRMIAVTEAADPTQPERGRGTNGFGYDPLFMLPDRGCTSAELSPEQKNAISHRGEAARRMWRRLREVLA